MTLDEIDARIKAIGRPALANFVDALKSGLVADVKRRQAEWDAANPSLHAEWRELVNADGHIRAGIENAARVEAGRKRELELMRKLAGDRIADNLHAPREEAPLVVARQWLASESWALTLLGTKGNGKTFAAAWATLASGLRPVVWLHSPTACARPLYGAQAQADMERAQRAPLVVLDDFGAELASAPWMTMLEAVLGVRHSRGLRTIVTSNLAKEDFDKRMGERLADRLKEGTQFATSAPSMRRRAS